MKTPTDIPTGTSWISRGNASMPRMTLIIATLAACLAARAADETLIIGPQTLPSLTEGATITVPVPVSGSAAMGANALNVTSAITSGTIKTAVSGQWAELRMDGATAGTRLVSINMSTTDKALTFDHVLFTSQTNTSTGGFNISSGAGKTLTINGDFEVRGAANTGHGGGMISATTNTEFNGNVIFTDNKAGYDGSTFSVASNGGGFYIYATSGSLLARFNNGVTFKGNTAGGHGGGMMLNTGASAIFKGNVIFDGNYAGGRSTSTYNGGGLYVATTATGDILFDTNSNVTFKNNTATNTGGGIYTVGHSIYFKGNVSFTGNKTTANSGGGIYLGSNASAPFLISFSGTPAHAGDKSVSFIANTSPSSGGGVAVFGSAEFKNGVTAEFVKNSGARGGGIYAGLATGVVNGSTFEFTGNSLRMAGNAAITADGGAIWAAKITLKGNFEFVGNQAMASGGALYTTSGGNAVSTFTDLINIEGSGTFKDNLSGRGGAISTANNSASINDINIKTSGGDIRFNSNVSTINGGAIYTAGIGSVVTLEATGGDIIFENNRAGVTLTTAAFDQAKIGDISLYNPATGSYTAGAAGGYLVADMASGTLNAIHLGSGVSLEINTNANRTVAFYDGITGGNNTGAINKNGAGTLVFDGAAAAGENTNTVNMTTNVNAGTFRLTRGAIYGLSNSSGAFTLSSTATLSGNGTLQANNITLSNGATIEVLGGGLLKLDAAGARTYGTGLKLLGSGTLDAGDILSAASISVGTLTPDNPAGSPLANTAQTLAFAPGSALNIENSGTIAIDMFGGVSSDKLVADTLTRDGATIINLTGISGTYTILTAYNSTFLETDFNILVNGVTPTARYTATPTVTSFNGGLGSELKIDYSEKNLAISWLGASGSTWKNSAATDGHWTDGAPANPEKFFKNGDRVTFGDSGVGRNISVDAAGVIVADMTVNAASGTYTIAGPGAITSSTTSTAGSLVTPTGRLMKTGAGTLNFANTAANNFIGGIDISGGAIGFTAANQLGDGGKGITFSASGTLRPNTNNLTFSNTLNINAGITASVDVVDSNTAAYVGKLGGAASGTFAKIGAGTLALGADNSAYAGTLLASSGNLFLAYTNARAVIVAPGATFGGSGSAASITTNPGAILQVGLPGVGGILNAGAATLAASTKLNFIIIDNTTNSKFQVQSGGLTLLGAPATYTLNFNEWISGTYNLGNAVALATGSVTLRDSTLNGRQTYATGTAGGLFQITINPTQNAIIVWSGTSAATAENGLWNSTADNWFGATAPGTRFAFADYDSVVFDDRVALPAYRTVDLATSYIASAMAVAGSGSYRFTGAGGVTTDNANAVGITADGKLTKTGAGTLTFANIGGNLFKGGITLGATGTAGGIVEYDRSSQLAVSNSAAITFLGNTTLRSLADASASGTLASAIAIGNAVTATLDTGANILAHSGSITLTGASGTLAKIGAGALRLSGNSAAATGLATNITAGTLILDGASLGGAVNLSANTTLSGAGAAATVRTAAGSVVQVGLGATTDTLRIADLQLATSSTLTGAGTLAGGATLTGISTALVTLGNDLTLSGTNAGAGGLVKKGAGQLVYTAASALGYTGGTQIDEGLVLFRGITGAAASGLAHTITLNGGWLDLSDSPVDPALTGTNANTWAGLNIVQGANAAAGGIIGTNDIITVHAGAAAYNIGIDTKAGVYVVVSASNGTATLTGTNLYKGYTRIDSGTLRVTADAQLGDTTIPREVILNGGALQISDTLATARRLELRAAGTVTVDPGLVTSWSGGITGTYAFTKAGSGTLVIANDSAAAATNVLEGRYVTTKNTGAGTGDVTIANGAVVEYRGTTGNIANRFTGAGTLVFAGGAATLTGTGNDIAKIALSHATVTGAAGSFGNAATAIALDAATLRMSSPSTVLGNVAMANSSTLAFTYTSGMYKRATLTSLTGGGSILLNTHLGIGRGDQLIILTAPHGDYNLVISNTIKPTGYTEPVTIIQAPSSADATFTVPGGVYTPPGSLFSYSVDTFNDGANMTVKIAGIGALSEAGQIINATAGALPLSWFSELTTINQRLGELRLDSRQGGKGGVNTWVRGYGQGIDYNDKATGAPFSERQIGADAGVDFKVPGTALGVYLGAFAGFGQIDRTFDYASARQTRLPKNVRDNIRAGDGSTESTYGGVYTTVVTPGGWYVDGILKVNGFDNKFSTTALTGETMNAQYNTFAVGGSIEAGKHFGFGKGWFVEPQVQAAYMVLGGNEYTTSNGIDVELRWGTTTQARAGVMLGRTFKTGFGEMLQIYLKGYVASQWTTDLQIEADGERFAPTIKGDRVEGGGGIAWLPSTRFQIYVDFETAKASYYSKPWGVNFGARYGW